MAGEPFFPQGQPEVKALLASLGLGEKVIVELDFHLHLAGNELAMMSLSYKELLDKDQLREVSQALQPFAILESNAVEVVRNLLPEEKIKFKEFL